MKNKNINHISTTYSLVLLNEWRIIPVIDEVKWKELSEPRNQTLVAIIISRDIVQQ